MGLPTPARDGPPFPSLRPSWSPKRPGPLPESPAQRRDSTGPVWRPHHTDKEDAAADTDAPHTTVRCHSSGYIYTLRGVRVWEDRWWLLTMMPVVKTGPGRLPFGLCIAGNTQCFLLVCTARPGSRSRRRRAAGRTAGHQIKSLPSSAAASGVVLARAGGVNLTWDIMLPSPRRRDVLRPVISHQSERDTTLTLTPQQQAATSGTQLTGVLHSSFGFFPRRPPPETCYNNNTTYFVQDLVQMGEPAGANAVTR